MASAEMLAWLSIAIMLMIVFLFSGAIYFFFYREKPEKPPTPESPASAETPGQKTETKFPAALKTAIALIIIGAIIWFVVIPVVIPFISNLGDSSRKTASTENIVTARVYANGYTCAVTPFFKKGQTIVITVTGNILDSTNQNRIGPEGYQSDPINIQGYKKCMSNIKYRASDILRKTLDILSMLEQV